MTKDEKKSGQIDAVQPSSPEHDEERRATLAQLGKFAAYTAPALMALRVSNKAAHASPA